MKTIVLQSFRTLDKPRWIARCLESVVEWARSSGFEYEYLNDDLFEMAPGWVRRRCAGNIYAVTDVCRLTWLRSKLDAGYDRVIRRALR